jgi:hypothetical protein
VKVLPGGPQATFPFLLSCGGLRMPPPRPAPAHHDPPSGSGLRGASSPALHMAARRRSPRTSRPPSRPGQLAYPSPTPPRGSAGQAQFLALAVTTGQTSARTPPAAGPGVATTTSRRPRRAFQGHLARWTQAPWQWVTRCPSVNCFAARKGQTCAAALAPPSHTFDEKKFLRISMTMQCE